MRLSMEPAVSSVRRLAGLRGWPLAGNLIAFRRDPLELLRRLGRLPGPLWQLRLGPQRVVVGSSPEVAEALLVRLVPAPEKGPVVRRWSRPLLGDGLISAGAEVHGARRAQLAPVLAWLRSEAWSSRLADLCKMAVQRLPGRLEGDLAATARSLVAAVLGPALIRGGAGGPAMLAAIEEVNRYLAARVRNPLLPPIGTFTAGARRAAAALASLEAAIDALMRERDGGAAGGDLLDQLRAIRGGAGEPLPARRIRDELVTLLVAAMETTGAALAWTLALLAAYPAAAERVRAEVNRVVGRGRVESLHLPGLVFCEQVIKESLRLWPPVHTLGRQVSQPVVLLGTRLPAGTVVAFSTYLLHRRPELYPDPDSFRPERFAQAAPGRFAYLPFGAGARACLGGETAMAALKLLVAGIAAGHDLAPVAPHAPQMLVTLRPRFG
jgi:pentalenene oxygenase